MDIKILKLGKIKWKELLILQNPTFKEMNQDEFQRLKRSMMVNDFIDPFKVWDSGDGIYCLDGKHRVDALRSLEDEGVTVPNLLPALFINCETKQQAASYVIVFSSRYARITYDGMYEFLHIHGLSEQFNEIAAMSDIPDIDMASFYDAYMAHDQLENFSLDEIDKIEPSQPKMIKCPNCGFEFEPGKDHHYGKREYENRPAKTEE